MPLGSSVVDDWVINNSGSASGQLTQTDFERALWTAVNVARYKKKRKALEQIASEYPSLDPQAILSELSGEVIGAAYP